MGHRDMMGDRRRSAQLLAWGIRFFLAAALTASQTPGDYAPFALGCVAACGPGAEGIAALLGAGVGAVLFLEFSGALPFLAAAILIFIDYNVGYDCLLDDGNSVSRKLKKSNEEMEVEEDAIGDR